MNGVKHRSNTRAGKAPLPAHNRKAGVSATNRAERWRRWRRRVALWLRGGAS